MALLAITMLGLIQLSSIAIRQNSVSRYNTTAVAVAQQMLEQLKTQYNSDLEKGIAPISAGEYGPQTVTVGDGTGAEFEVRWTVNDLGSSKMVTVSVSPLVANDFEAKTLILTAVFSP